MYQSKGPQFTSSDKLSTINKYTPDQIQSQHHPSPSILYTSQPPYMVCLPRVSMGKKSIATNEARMRAPEA